MHADDSTPSPVLRARGLTKTFPGVRALVDVKLDVAAGEVHAIMGENGAGKSTLMRLLSGFEQPDAGGILFKGQAVRFRHPHEAMRCGIAMIHQELMPFPELTVAENILMGQEPASRFLGWIDRRRLNERAAGLLARIGSGIAPDRRLGDLGIAGRQTVEIAKALAHAAEVLIMDEPTSALSAPEVRALFQLIADLKCRGIAILYVSHRMEEIFEMADTVTVLRDGRHMATAPRATLTPQRLIALMAGRDGAGAPAPGVASAEAAVRATTPGPVSLRVRGLSRGGCFRDINFELRQGEIVGLAGLMGAGRTNLLHAIYGLEPADAGTIEVHGSAACWTHPRQALRAGVALVPEDRRDRGLVMALSVQHNTTLCALDRCSRLGFIAPAREAALTDAQIRALAIKTPGRDTRVDRLSGGNQQKVVLAKALLTGPGILLLDEPTRGVDVGAKGEIQALIRHMARAGKTILVASSEMPELMAVSDRILVMREGRLVAELDPRRTTQSEILRHAMP